MSARRVSPVMRISSERVLQVIAPEPPLPTSAASSKPPIPLRSASRETSSTERTPTLPQEADAPAENQTRNKDDSVRDETPKRQDQIADEEIERPDTDLPIQNPSMTKTPSPSRPPVLQKVSSHRITIMSTSDYSSTSPRRSLENPITRETSPELHRNSQGVVPSHKAYDSISFLPMHPLLSPLQDPSDPWELGTQSDPDKATTQTVSDRPPPSVSPPKPIPMHTDTEGAVNASHPLLLAERHTRFATRSPPIVPKPAIDLPLRHYRSSEAFQRPRVGPSEEKEVFVPPNRSSALIYDGTMALARNSPNPLSAPPNRSSATPSPLNVNQTQRAVTPSKLNLKSSKASIVTGPSTASTSTASAADDSATPPAISRSRSPISHSKSTPNLSSSKRGSQTQDINSSDSVKSKALAANGTPVYLKPVSSAALIDFLASTPPPSPPKNQAKSTTILKSRGTFGPAGKHSGGFSIFPSSPRLMSPATGRPMGSLNNSIDAATSATTPASPNTEKKGWKKVFKGGSKKSKSGKEDGVPDLMESPEPEKYRAKKKSGKEHKKQCSNDAIQNGAGRATPDSSGFMGVGKDGVWISRKNFLRT